MKPVLELPKYFFERLLEDSRFYLCSGGRGSGKSFNISTYLLLKISLETEQVIVFSRWTMTSAEISVIPEFVEKIDLLGLSDEYIITNKEIISKKTGSKIIFMGIKSGSKVQTGKLKSIAGLTIFVVDEAEEFASEETFNTLNYSIRKKGLDQKIILIFNPPSKTHWLYDRFYLSKGVEPGSNVKKGNVSYIHTTFKDNIENLGESFLEEIAELKEKDFKKYNETILGAFKEKAEGLIIENWELGDFPDDSDFEFGLDFGYSNDPTALIKCKIDSKKKVLYVKEELYKTKIIPSELGNICKNKTSNKLIVADSASPDLIAEILRKGNNIIPVKKTDIVVRLEILREYKLIVDPSSKNIVDELNNYCWDANYKKGDKAIDDYNHAIDAINYYVLHRHRNPKIKRFRIG